MQTGLSVSTMLSVLGILLGSFLGSGSILVLVIMQCYVMITAFFSLLVMYLAYHIVSHYTRLLKITLARNLTFKSSIDSNE